MTNKDVGRISNRLDISLFYLSNLRRSLKAHRFLKTSECHETFFGDRLLSDLQKYEIKDLAGYFRLFIVATGCPSEQRPKKTVSCYGG